MDPDVASRLSCPISSTTVKLGLRRRREGQEETFFNLCQAIADGLPEGEMTASGFVMRANLVIANAALGRSEINFHPAVLVAFAVGLPDLARAVLPSDVAEAAVWMIEEAQVKAEAKR